MPELPDVALVQDQRRPPFCYQTHAALDAIRARYEHEGVYGKVSVALAVYLAFTEAANRSGGDAARNGFTKERTEIARLAGVSPSTFDRYVPELVAAGVLGVVQRREGKVNLPNAWTLLDSAVDAPPLRVDADTPLRVDAEEELRTLEPKKTSEPNGSLAAAPLDKPPALVKFDGQDIAFDVLAGACGCHDRNAQRLVAVALNGKRGVTGIRQLAWDELTEPARVLYLNNDPGVFEHYLTAVIRKRAAAYRAAMPRVMLTPLALAMWWGRVECLTTDAGVSPDELERIADAAAAEASR